VNYDDETLMAYADGELDETQRAEIAAAVERDPELARRVARHRALRAEVSAAFSSVLSRPMPERLARAAQGQSANDQSGRNDSAPATRRGTVVQFPGRASRAPATAWRAREWTAMAASLGLGAVISWKVFAPDPALIMPKGGELVASGALATALERQLGSKQLGNEPVLIGLTFRTENGQYCRSYALAHVGTAGLACRVGGDWQIVNTAAAPNEGGDVRQATSPPPAVMHAIESRISGDALDAAGEENARNAGWNPAYGQR
jgi:hypothetical protein